MTKQNRALRAIDKNSLPKVLDVLEVSRAKQSKASNEPPKAERSDGNGRSFSIPSRKGWDKPMALSKTPKMSNLGGNRNVTTRRGRASNMRPPKPNAINSARRNRKSLGSSILTPYGAQMARLQNRKTIEKAFTPSLSKSPNLLRHYNRLKPITCRLYNQHSKQHQELEHSKSLTGNSQERVSSKQKTTINSTPSLTRTTNANTMKPPIAPLKGRSATSETSRQGNITEYETDNHNENENENSSDDMNCDSSDELSLNSSSSSSHSSLPQKSTYASSRKSSSQDGLIAPFSKANNGSTSQTGEEHQCTKKSLHSESNLKLSSERDDTRNIDSQKFVSSLIVATDQTDADVTEGTKNASASATTTIEDQEVFNLVMGCNSKEIDTDLLGSTIGDCRFSRNNVDEDSVLTTCSSVRAQKSATASKEKAEQVEREVFRTPLYASRDPGSSPLVSNEQNNQKKIAQKIHNQSNEYLEEESVEAWSIHGHRSSPFFFEIGGKKYGHPALPPGWTMRISSGENLPVYTHPDHGRTWHCPIKLTPNMMYAKTSSGKFVKQIKSSLSESAPKLYLESSTEDVLMPRSARGARPTPQTPPSIRDERSCEKERKQSVSQLKGTVVVDHLPPEQEDEDSTSELLKDISRLSAGLIKNSSSNLEKAEKVKTLHKKTQNLTKDVLSAEKQLGLKQQNQRLLSPQDLKPQTLSTMTSLLHQNDQTSTFETRRPRTKKLDFNESASPQDHEVETPSTMSAVLRQYEQTLACGHSVTTFSESQADDSRKQGVANRNLSKSFTHESARKQLSPIRESMGRSNVADGIKNMKSDRRGEWDMFSNISTKKKDKSKESIHRLSSETSFHNYGTSLLRRAAMSESEKKAMNQPRRIMPSNLNSFTKPANGDTKSTPNLLQLQKSKNTEHVEAWFTPTVQIEKVSGSAKDNISNCNFKDDTVLRFGVRKKKGSRSRLLSTEKIAQNEGLQTTTSFETNPYPSTLKGSSRPVKHPSTLYHDEWSPLAQLHSAGDKMHPKQKGSYESMPDSPVGVGYKPTGAVHIQENPCTLTLPLKEAESLNCNKNTNRSCGIPREIHRKSQSSSENENSKDGASIDSGLQSTQIMEDQCSLKVQKTNDTIHAVQETKDLLQPEEKYDATSEPKNKNVKCVDTVPNLESFEIAVNGSSDALSTKSDSDLSSNVDNHEQASETNNNEVISVTIAVHAHSTKKIRSSTIDVFDAARLDRPGQFDNSESFASIDVERPYAYDKSGNSRDIVAREDTPSRHDVKPNDVTGSGIKSDVYDDNESTLSQESYHSSEIAYTNTGHDGDTTNVCTMEDTEEDITAQSPLESADEKAISEFGTSCELCTTKGKSIAHNSENADDGCTYSSDTYNEAGSGNGSFTFADDMSDGFENSRIQANVQPSVFRANNGNVQGTTSSAEECFSPLKEDLDNNIDGAGSETESSIESPVQPTTFEKCDSYRSPQIEERNSSIESPVHLTADDSYCSPEIEDSNNTKRSIRGYRTISSTPRKQNRMSWRVLNPPHPICSLQHLEELILQNKRKELQAKQPKGGRQTKRKKYSAKRRRKSKSRGRY